MRGIIHKEDNQAYLNGQEHLELSQKNSFSQTVFELLAQRKPSQRELKVFDLILNLSSDHGPETPSAIETIRVTKEGKSLSESVAAGVLQINNCHGGAMTPLMEMMYKIERGETSAKQVVVEKLKNKERLPGFGHRIYKDQDPRAELIIESSQSLKKAEEFTKIVRDLREELNSQVGKSLPVNIDGGIAVALCSLGFEPIWGTAVFLIARTPGLIAQYLNNT